MLSLLIWVCLIDNICAQNEGNIDQETFNEYKEQLDYSNTKTIWVPRFEPDFKKKERENINPKVGNLGSGVFNWLIYLIVGFLLVFMIYLFATNLPQKDKKLEIYTDEEIEDIEGIDAIGGYKNALKDLNYRMAIRMKFIRCLQLLEENKKIDWQPEKTNRNYVREIKEGDLKSHFRDLAAHFEYAWYGNLELSKERFLRVDQSFDDFIRKEQRH